MLIVTKIYTKAFLLICQKPILLKKAPTMSMLFSGGEGETRTLAPVTRPTPLAGAPRHQLEYFSIDN